jgi:hypothetical protein
MKIGQEFQEINKKNKNKNMRNLFQIEPSEKQRILEQHNFFKNVLTEKNNRLKKSNKGKIQEQAKSNLKSLTGREQLEYALQNCTPVAGGQVLYPPKGSNKPPVISLVATANTAKNVTGASAVDMKTNKPAANSDIQPNDRVYFEEMDPTTKMGFYTAFTYGPSNPKDPNSAQVPLIKKQGRWQCSAVWSNVKQDVENQQKDLERFGYVPYDKVTFKSNLSQYDQKPCGEVGINSTGTCYKLKGSAQVIPQMSDFDATNPSDKRIIDFLTRATEIYGLTLNPNADELESYIPRLIDGAKEYFGSIPVMGYYPKTGFKTGATSAKVKDAVNARMASADTCANALDTFFDLFIEEGSNPKYTSNIFAPLKISVQRCTRRYAPEWEGLTAEGTGAETDANQTADVKVADVKAKTNKKGFLGIGTGINKRKQMLNNKLALLSRQLTQPVEINGKSWSKANSPTLDSTFNLGNNKG